MATHSRGARGIPIRSVAAENPEQTQGLRDAVYLDELERQSSIAVEAVGKAWRRGMDTEDAQDALTWSHLQAALFAGIVVVRLLRPGRARAAPGRTAAESQSAADARGRRLRDLLGIADDAHLFAVADIRNALEHFDERIDAYLAAGVHSLVDWYITDGLALITPPEGVGGPTTGAGLRVFYPAGGLLGFDEKQLDIFLWDVSLLNLRESVRAANLRLHSQGRAIFGGHQLVQMLPPDRTLSRCQAWLDVRDQAGEGLGVTLRE